MSCLLDQEFLNSLALLFDLVIFLGIGWESEKDYENELESNVFSGNLLIFETGLLHPRKFSAKSYFHEIGPSNWKIDQIKLIFIQSPYPKNFSV